MMDPRITPTTNLGTAFLAALQAAPGDAQIQLLLSLVGQNLDLLLLESGNGGATLRMPSGQVVEAEGDLPYPTGTRLTVQVQPPLADQVAPRLKLLEAQPPPPAPILAPLVQGEGPQLLARLRAADPPPELQPLVRLLATLAPETAPASPGPAASGPATPPTAAPMPAPSVPVAPQPAAAQPAAPGAASSGPAAAGPGPIPPERILAWLRNLPPAAVATLQRALLPPSGAPRPLPELVEAVQKYLANTAAAEAGSAPLPTANPASAPTPGPGSTPKPAPAGSGPPPPPAPLPEPVLPDPSRVLRDPSNLAQNPLPAPTASGLAAPAPAAAGRPATAFDPGPFQELLRLLLAVGPGFEDLAPQTSRAAPPDSAPTAPRPAPDPHPAASGSAKSSTPALAGEPKPATPRSSDPLPATTARANAGSNAEAAHPAESPRAWSQWLSEGVKALADPQASPREAPFHLAQAREGTAFFELPLPWEAPDQVLQMWVEQDGGQGGRPGAERTTRVTVGLHFSALGETRIGVVRAGQGDRLQVRVWAEHPGPLREREAQLRADLADLGPGLDFQVLPLAAPGEPVPDLRALALGPGFQALG